MAKRLRRQTMNKESREQVSKERLLNRYREFRDMNYPNLYVMNQLLEDMAGFIENSEVDNE